MKTLFVFILCCTTLSVQGQFQPRKSSPKIYTVEAIKLPVFKPHYLLATNRSVQQSIIVQPQSNYVPNLAVATGSSSLGPTYSYTTRRGNTAVYTFDVMGNYTGSNILLKEKEQKKKSDKKKFRP